MRVLALVTDAFGGHGGIAQYNRDLLTALAACDEIQEVVVLPRAARETLPDVMPRGIRQANPVNGRIAYCLAAFWAALKMRQLDAVFCGHLFMAPLAVVIAKVFRVPLWVQVHGIDAWDELSFGRRRAIEAATLVTAVSRYTRKRVLETSSISPPRVKVLPNTVDRRFCRGPKPNHLLERHGLEGKSVLITVSRLAASERYKGHDRVLNALPALIAERPKLTYLIVGEGDDRARLEGLVAQLGISENVRFVGPVVPRELPDYYRLADVFVMPSTGEGFGIVFLEAMASGVPTIAGDSDGSRDPLCDGTFGALIDPNSTRELQAAIRAALDNPSVRSDAAERFGTEKFAVHVSRLVRCVLVDGQFGSRRVSKEYVVMTTTVHENGSPGRACDTI